MEDVLTKAEKLLQSITADDSLDRYGKHIADWFGQISSNQIKSVQKCIGDVSFEGEMKSFNRNCKIVNIGKKEVYSCSSIQHTYPP